MLKGTLEYSSDLFVSCQVEEILSAVYKELSRSSLLNVSEIKLFGYQVEHCLIDGSPHRPYVGFRLEYVRGSSQELVEGLVRSIQQTVSCQLPEGMFLPVTVNAFDVASVY